MSWLKIETCTPDKPEVWAIADALGIDADAAFGKVFRVWAWFDQHTESGNAQVTRRALLDRIAGVTGFADAMIDASWLVDDDGVLSLPNFDRHNGQTAKARALTAKRVAQHKRSGNADANAEVTRAALPREEKRREEKNTEYTPIVPSRGDDRPRRKRSADLLPQRLSFAFESWWLTYPRRIGKAAAARKYAVAVERLEACGRDGVQILAEAVAAFAAAQAGKETQFVPHPATWLNQGRWDDDMDGERQLSLEEESERVLRQLEAQGIR